MTSEKTTVIVPCYNAEKVIARTLDSLLAQTRIPDEILVIDDGSSDNSAEIASGYGAGVRVFRQENQGAGVARHKGVELASNELLIFIDAGDIAPPGKVQVLSQALIDHPECVCAFGGHWNRIKEKPTLGHFDQKPFDGHYTVVEDPFAQLVEHSFPVSLVMNIAVRKQYALKAKIGDFYKAGNDYAFQLSLARFGPFVYVADITIEFEILPKGISDTIGIDQQMAFSLFAAVDFFHKHPHRQRYKKLFKRRISFYWPEISFYLYITSRRKYLGKVVKTGLIHGSIIDSIRAFKWTLEKARNKNELKNNPCLRMLASLIP